MLSKSTTDQIRKEAEEWVNYPQDPAIIKGYIEGATAWAIWKEKAEGYEKALKEINEMSVCYNAIAIATKALESFNQNKVK